MRSQLTAHARCAVQTTFNCDISSNPVVACPDECDCLISVFSKKKMSVRKFHMHTSMVAVATMYHYHVMHE